MYRSDVDKMNEPNGMDKLCMKVFQAGDSEPIPHSFEERLAKKCPWLYRGAKFHIVKEFIRQEKELSRKEGYDEGYQSGRDSIFSQRGLVFLGKGPKTEDLNETT